MEDSPEAQAGRRLDSHHEPRVAGVSTSCAVCGFNTDDGFDRDLRHLPLPYEVRRVDAWIAEHDPPPAA
jgi:hypothetical protein